LFRREISDADTSDKRGDRCTYTIASWVLPQDSQEGPSKRLQMGTTQENIAVVSRDEDEVWSMFSVVGDVTTWWFRAVILRGG
jgi:hypothetical protein